MSPSFAAPNVFGADISRLKHYAPEELIGREVEFELLNNAWAGITTGEVGRPHILIFVALGGEGKTSVVAKWLAELAQQDWPGCDAAFAWSFYSQGTREQAAASSDLFLNEALTFFGDAEMAGSVQGAFDKGRRLARLVGERRALLILDGLEPLQYAPTSPTPGELKDAGVAALLKGLAANSHGLSVVTTRYAVPDLRAFLGKTVREEKLTRLSQAAGVALLKTSGVKGTPLEFEKLVEDVQGHALTLNLLGSYLRDAHAGDIRRRNLVKLEEADAEEQGGHAFRVMDAYVEAFECGGKTAEDQTRGRRALALLALLGLFDRPAAADCLNALWQGEAIGGLTEPLAGLSEAQRNLSLKRLEDAKLIIIDRDGLSGSLISVDAHPLVREYFGNRLCNACPVAFRAAHGRLCVHLCATTPEKSHPELKDLEPLYQAIAHGCHAGWHREVRKEIFVRRIQRENEFYSVNSLGAVASDLGAAACFFDRPWDEVSPGFTMSERSWLLNEAGYGLKALGRIAEAQQPMRISAEIDAAAYDYGGAAISYVNLSELAQALGDLGGASKYVDLAVTCADRSHREFIKAAFRAARGDVLHHAGFRDEALTNFLIAEQMQANNEPDYPLLYGLGGFFYCELLLSRIERATWQIILGIQQTSGGILTHRASLDAISQRVATTLDWATHHFTFRLIAIALDYLTLGRIALFDAILADAGEVEGFGVNRSSSLSNAQLKSATAVTALRETKDALRLIQGLLVHGQVEALKGGHSGMETAKSNFDEAMEIARRGPMPLFVADVYLYRARLSLHGLQYPSHNREGLLRSSASDLTNARDLIDKHGYWRRKEELEDAETALQMRGR